MLAIRRNYVRVTGGHREGHQDPPDAPASRSTRRPSRCSPSTAQRYEERCRALGVRPSDGAFLFSYQPAQRPAVRPERRDPPVRRGCAPSSASTATCTPCGTTRRPSCSRPASTCAPSPAGSATAAAARPRCGSTRPGSASPTARPRSCSPGACSDPGGETDVSSAEVTPAGRGVDERLGAVARLCGGAVGAGERHVGEPGDDLCLLGRDAGHEPVRFERRPRSE